MFGTMCLITIHANLVKIDNCHGMWRSCHFHFYISTSKWLPDARLLVKLQNLIQVVISKIIAIASYIQIMYWSWYIRNMTSDNYLTRQSCCPVWRPSAQTLLMAALLTDSRRRLQGAAALCWTDGHSCYNPLWPNRPRKRIGLFIMNIYWIYSYHTKILTTLSSLST